MIYRSRLQVPEPPVLAAVGSPAARERARATAHYGGSIPPTTNMTFTVYKRDQVKQALARLFAGKCAYCESNYLATQPMEVEHYRPKGEVRTASGVKLPNGYWWRASMWENLLPSCNDCNRERWHQVGKEKFKHGKHSKFPLASAVHATDEAGIAQEVPLLIEPSSENPSVHLGFRFEDMESPVVYAKPLADGADDPKGSTSIEVYGLNRPGLVETRGSHLHFFQMSLRSLEKGRLSAERIKGDAARYQAELAEWRDEVNAVVSTYLDWKSPYVAMCRAYFSVWKDEFKAKLSAMEDAQTKEVEGVVA